MLVVYVGGHGATDAEKQIYLLNETDAKLAQFQIEFKLRYIANDPTSITQVFGVFDCCRVPLNEMKGLINARGKTSAVMDDLDSEKSQEDEPCNYF